MSYLRVQKRDIYASSRLAGGARRSSRPRALSCSDAINPSMSFRRPGWAPILVVVALAAAAIVAVPSVREQVLRTAGWAVVVNEPVAPADIIVISLDSGGAGVLEAADLVQSGIATRVAVFADPPSGEDYELIRRGLPYEGAGASQLYELRWLGVTDVVQIPMADVGSEGEGQVLPAMVRPASVPIHCLRGL